MAAAGTVLDTFPGLLRSLTVAAKSASEQLLNQDFERLFKVECMALRAPEVKLEFPGREGQPRRKKTVAARYALSAILSEGEQKVIALADFLAEVGLPKAPGPIVFDDPVNSLDYKRLEYVVNRVVQLSESRQVVVFTHNIWFAILAIPYIPLVTWLAILPEERHLEARFGDAWRDYKARTRRWI